MPRHLTPADLITALDVTNSLAEQNGFLESRSFETLGHLDHQLAERPTRLRLRLRDLAPEGVIRRRIEVATPP